MLIFSLLFQTIRSRSEIEQLPEPVLRGRRRRLRSPVSRRIPSAAPSVVLLDATESAVLAGPRTSASGHASESWWRRRIRRDRRDAHTGSVVFEAADVRRRRRRQQRWKCRRRSPQPQPVDRFQSFATVVVGRRVRYVRLSHGATGHVPGGVQDAAQGADQDATHLRHAAAVQRVAGLLDGRAGRGRTSGQTGTVGLSHHRHRRRVVDEEDHAQVHTQEQEPGHVRLPSGR